MEDGYTRLNILLISVAILIFGILINDLKGDVKELQENIIVLEQRECK